MSGHRNRGGHGQRPHYPRPREDFYDERRSRSRSPPARNGSPHRRSPPHDVPRGPSQYHARDSTYNRERRSRSPRGYSDRRPDRRGSSRDYSRSPGRDRRSRSSHSRNRSASQDRGRSRSQDSWTERAPSRGRPSKEVMIEGLAPHITENDVITELQQHYHIRYLDDVRIIRDRQTRQSRQFGFLRFATLDEAEAFMDANYPTIYLYGSDSDNMKSDEAKVRITFRRERKETRAEEGEWTCKICNINNYATRLRCFRCQTLRPEPSTGQKPANVGDNDAAPDNTPSQFLLLRGLESSVTEEVLAKGVAKLNKPSGGQTQTYQPSAKKGAKVASTTGDANLGAKEGTLRRVFLVRDRRTQENWRYGFAEYASIDDAQAALTRYNSFDRFTIASKQVLVSYIHAGVFIPVINPSASTDRFTFNPIGNPSMKLAYWDEEAYVAELPISLPDPVPPPPRTGTVLQAEPDSYKSTKDADKAKKRKAQDSSANPATAKKATASHLQFWSSRHAELHGIKSKDGHGNGNGAENADDTGKPPAKSYADPNRNCCYLCMREFTTMAEVNKHERLSDLHRSNLKDEAKVKRAEHKLEKHGVTNTSATEYRDRARERRKTYGVVNKKGEQVGGSKSGAKPSLSDDDDDGRGEHGKDTAPTQSKGASLLSKMGYTAGQGLGASGEGRTEALRQDIYVAGVGLGAAGGKVGDAVKEAERNTKGDYQGFVERSREGARERYRNMG